MITAVDALKRLQEGNRRFVTDIHDGSIDNYSRRVELTEGQSPFAIILGCADSRVPAELVFDQGLGDLFVIRVAGNIVAPSLVGSVEYAAAVLGTRLVVVMGHTSCGAVKATLDEIASPSPELSPNLEAIVSYIRPSVESLDLTEAVRANVRTAAADLRSGSAILRELIENDGLQVVGAEYSLATGEVEFFDGV